MEAEVLAPPLDDLCKQLQPHMEEDEEEEEGSYRCHMEGLIQNLLKEARDKAKCWVSQTSTDNVELAFRKVRALTLPIVRTLTLSLFHLDYLLSFICL